MNRKFEVTITYTIDKNHPDYNRIDNPQAVHSFTGVYTFNGGIFDLDDTQLLLDWAQNDIALIAGGGYSTEHIHNVHFKESEVQDY